MEIIRIAPIERRVNQHIPTRGIYSEISKHSLESRFVRSIEVDLAGLIDKAHSVSSGAELLFAPRPIEQIGLGGSDRAGAALLVQKIVQPTLKAGQREIIPFGFFMETVSSARFFARGRAELESNHKEKYENP